MTGASERRLWRAVAILVAAMLGVLQFYRPARSAPTAPFAAIAAGRLRADASPNAFGASRELWVRFALPGDHVEFPLQVSGDPSSLTYEWVGSRDSVARELPRPVNGAEFIAPNEPGFYHLAIVRGIDREVIPEPTLAVMVPFDQKVGATMNGYHIGTYLAERFGHHEHPAGFLEVREADAGLKVSKHLRLADFITHDSQANVWPKYVALNPRLLDKLELVLAKVGAHARLMEAEGDAPPHDSTEVAFDVHSGFRTPAHNSMVRHSARDSQHQYGDAADVVIDADGDGRITLHDQTLVAQAVDEVEEEHPDLVGGLGLYTSRRYRTPYVHIDARGKRSRWKG